MSRGVLPCLLFCASLLAAQPKPEDVFKYLSLDYPGLEKVKRAVVDGKIALAKAELLDYFRTRVNRTFDETLVELHLDKDEAYRSASNVLSFKSYTHSFGPKIDWWFNAVDKEWNFTLNRMAWFNNLVAVYKTTRDERLVQAWKEQIMSWIELGDPGFPRTIDTGRRLEHLVFSHWMFVTRLRSPSVDADFNAVLLASIHEQCEHLYKADNWRRYSNWGTFENSGFSKAAVMFPEFARSRMWLREMFFRMQVQLQLSFDNDGMHVELSPLYHSNELNVWYDFARLTEQNKVGNPWVTQTLQPTHKELLRTRAEALAYLVKPTGYFPQVGDTDQEEKTGFLEMLGEYLDTPHIRFIATKGKEGSRPEHLSKAFPDAGYFILRSGWGESGSSFVDQMYVLFDATTNYPWHAHLDAFNLLITAYGKDLLVDPGRFTYNVGPERDLFLSSSSHNTVVINNTDQGKSDSKPEALWRFFDSFDYVRGKRVQEDVSHERHVLFLKPEYLIVVDRLKGKGTNSYDQYWHLDARAEGHIEIGNGRITTPNLVLVSSVPRQNVSVEKGFISYKYREKQPAPVIRCSVQTEGELILTTLLYPYREKPADVEMSDLTASLPRGTNPGVCLQIRHSGYTDIVFLRTDSIQSMPNVIETDGDVVIVRLSSDQRVEKLSALNASYAHFKGRPLFDAYDNKCDISFDGSRIVVQATNLNKLSLGLPAVSELVVNGRKVKTVSRNGMMIYD